MKFVQAANWRTQMHRVLRRRWNPAEAARSHVPIVPWRVSVLYNNSGAEEAGQMLVRRHLHHCTNSIKDQGSCSTAPPPSSFILNKHLPRDGGAA